MKILLLSFGLSLTVITASAQSKGPLVIPGRNLGEKATYTRPDDAICQPALNIPFGEKNDRALTANESTIGTTYYDLQTNKALSNRFYLYADGTMGAVWTMGFQSSDFPDRGTGYNFYDGNSFILDMIDANFTIVFNQG